MHRPHHYNFAHVALREAFFSNPSALANALRTQGTATLFGFWAHVGAMLCQRQGGTDLVAPEGLAVTQHELGDWVSFVVDLPEPKDVNEAHFVGLLIRKPADDHPRTARFLVLEASTPDPSGTPRTVLGEWLPDRHHVHGVGSEPTRDAFVEMLEARFCDAA